MNQGSSVLGVSNGVLNCTATGTIERMTIRIEHKTAVGKYAGCDTFDLRKRVYAEHNTFRGMPNLPGVPWWELRMLPAPPFLLTNTPKMPRRFRYPWSDRHVLESSAKRMTPRGACRIKGRVALGTSIQWHTGSDTQQKNLAKDTFELMAKIAELGTTLEDALPEEIWELYEKDYMKQLRQRVLGFNRFDSRAHLLFYQGRPSLPTIPAEVGGQKAVSGRHSTRVICRLLRCLARWKSG